MEIYIETLEDTFLFFFFFKKRKGGVNYSQFLLQFKEIRIPGVKEMCNKSQAETYQKIKAVRN